MPNSPSIIVTGASSGIGKALAHAFAKRGYRLGLVSRRLRALEEVRTQLRAEYPGAQVELAAIDVDEVLAVNAKLGELFSRLGQVDIVVVNAGVNRMTRVGTGQLDDELQLLQTNLLGAVATVHAAAAYFRGQTRGHIVGISSLAARNAIPRQAAYCASKAGLLMYLDAAREELARHDIAVTSILPGFVATDIVPGFDIGRIPFAVSPERAAEEMVPVIEARRSTAIVPAFPWQFVAPMLRVVPKGILRAFKSQAKGAR